MVKICHMTSAHRSGDTRIFEKECTSLAKKENYQVFLVARGESSVKNGVRIVGAGGGPKSRIQRMLFTTRRIYKKALSLDADVYQFHDPELLRYGLKLKKAGKMVIFDCHEDVPGQIMTKAYIPKPFRGLAAGIYRRRQDRAIPRYDAVITATPHVYERLKTFQDHTYLITNFPIITPGGAGQLEKPGTIVFAGGVDPQWSHAAIIQALDGVDHVQYDIFGRADETYLQELAALPGWSKVVYHGFCDFAEVQAAMKGSNAAMALCRPSGNTNGRKGNLANTKLFEAMQLGIPVIATDFDLWKEIVEGGACGICVNPSDVDAIRSAISYLITNREAAGQMGRNARRLAEEAYNWESQEQILFQLYEQVLKQ